MKTVWQDRRSFLAKVATIGAVAAGSAILMDEATAKEAQITLPASTESRCATCEFWGGQRHVSADRKNVTAAGTGFCNNAKSPMYQKKTPHDHMMSETWKKWDALNA